MFNAHDLAVRVRAGTPLILIETQEEALLQDTFHHVVSELMRPLWRWRITDGLKRLDLDSEDVPPCNDSGQGLEFMQRQEQRGIWLLFDFHPYLRYAMNLRRLREVALGQGAAQQTVVLIGPASELPTELEPLVTRLRMQLPDEAELGNLLREEAF